MRKVKLILIILIAFGCSLAIYFVLSDERALLANPKGAIAQAELDIIIRNILLMCVVIVPFFIILFSLVWRYGAKKSRGKHDSEHSAKIFEELFMWFFPATIILIMAYLTWFDTHALDPYKPIEAEKKPLKIQVVALDWKWLFIYPEQGVASVNFVQFPEKTPVQFFLSADGSPMNGFWIPQLSGQIYCMSGMTTQLHVIASEQGEFPGRASEINGEGFADMWFIAKSSSLSDFNKWIDDARQSPLKLTKTHYKHLVEPSRKNPVRVYSTVADQLFDQIVTKYADPKVSEDKQ